MNDPELTKLADIYGAALDKWADIELWRNESFDAQTAVDNAMSELCHYVREHYSSAALAQRDAAAPTATADSHGFDPTANFVKVPGGWDKRGVGG